MSSTPEYSHHEHQVPEQHVAALLDVYEHMAPGQVADTYRMHLGFDDAHLEALARLPAQNLAQGSEVYRTFAESADPADRKEIIMYLPRLCLVDRVAGLELWDHLIRDSDDDVRRTAFNELDGERLGLPSLDPLHQEAEEELRRESIGLTWQDIAHLCRAHVHAERVPATRYQPSSPRGAQPPS